MAIGNPELTGAERAPRGQSVRFASLLSEKAAELPADGGVADRLFLSDLNFDQIVGSVAGDREERELISQLLSRPAGDLDSVTYRHEVFRDLADPALFKAVQHFSEQVRQARTHLAQLSKMFSVHQREGWFLDAATIYCDAVRALADVLAERPLASRGLLAFRDYLTSYTASSAFQRLAAEAADCRNDLAKVTYQVRIKGLRVEISRYTGEPDYSAEIEKTFERFQHGAVRDYLVRYRTWPGMNHVGAQIVDLVARLFPEEFAALAGFCQRHADFMDQVIGQAERELQFYLAYLDYIRPMQSAGLSFCYPELTATSRRSSPAARLISPSPPSSRPGARL